MTRVELDETLKSLYSEMESRGFRVDIDGLKSYHVDLESRIMDIEGKLEKATGESDFNPASAKQLAPILEKLGYTLPKTKTGRLSISTDVIETFASQRPHEVLDLLIQHKDVHYAESRVKKFLEKIRDKAPGFEDEGRVKYKFVFYPDRGRIFTENECVQNIFKGLRNYLKPEPGCKLVAFDFSSQEFVLLCAHAGQMDVIEKYQQGNYDVHKFVASKVFGIKESEVTTEQRKSVKSVTYGLLYGQSAYGLAKARNSSQEDAQKLMDLYFAALPKVKEYMDSYNKKIVEQGYSENFLGEKTMLDRSAMDMSEEFRRCFNQHIQGGGADILRLALKQYKDKYIHPPGWQPHFPHTIVYDSIVFSIPIVSGIGELDCFEYSVNSLKEFLAVDIAVNGNKLKLHLDVKIGDSWGEITA